MVDDVKDDEKPAADTPEAESVAAAQGDGDPGDAPSADEKAE